MRIESRSLRTRAALFGCLAVALLAGCSKSVTGDDDDGNNDVNPCSVGRPATLTINGAPNALAATAVCGGVVQLQNNLAGTSLYTKGANAVTSIITGRTAGTYTVSAANKTTVQMYYSVENQTGFCNNPSGTIVMSTITPTIDGNNSRVEGTYTNVTLCNSTSALAYTVSGTFKIQ
jgi:hypothetical protein